MNSEERRLHAQTLSAARVATALSEVDRKLAEHLELCAMVERMSFLLHSVVLAHSMNALRRDAIFSAVHEAEQLLGRIKQ